MAAVTVVSKEGLRADVEVGSHHLIADEPETLGGHNAGPNPYGYLMTALGSCTALTLRMYANHKQWPLGKITVELDHTKVDGKDHITRKLNLEGNLSEEQIVRLKEIATKCPVSKTLAQGVVVNVA